MPISPWLIIFLIIPFLSSCMDDDQKLSTNLENRPNSSDPVIVREISGALLKSVVNEKTFEILGNSRMAVYYSVKKNPLSEIDYLELNSPQELSSTFFNEIRSLLMDDSSYLAISEEKALFTPNLAIEMRMQEEKLVILIAAGCKQVRFIQDNEPLTLECNSSLAGSLEKLINSLRRKKDE